MYRNTLFSHTQLQRIFNKVSSIYLSIYLTLDITEPVQGQPMGQPCCCCLHRVATHQKLKNSLTFH